MKQGLNLKIMGRRYLLFAAFALTCLIIPGVSYSQNVFPQSSYCYTDAPVTLRSTTPSSGKTWTCSVNGVITNIFNGEAIFSPSLVPGPYPKTITILYQNPNYAGEPAAAYNPGSAFFTFSVTITTPPVVTFSVMPEVCQDAAAFSLSPYVNPAGGSFSGPGVDAAGFFYPSVAGPGTHTISYTYPKTGCRTTVYQNIVVRATPPVSIASMGPFCIDATPITLNTGSPGGGTYSGPGVSGNTFTPGSAGVGIHSIKYTYFDGYCTGTASVNVTVNPLPAVTISGLLDSQCDTDPSYTITGSPTNANGSFTGHGITDNLNGTALFDPGTTGLGYHDIAYKYTDANGCFNTYTKKVRVGTELYIYGLGSSYCEKNAIVNFTYTPVNSSNPLNRISGDGVTDNLDGTATFNPAAAGLGNHTIKYTFWDDIGCENIITQPVTVFMNPSADFSGLSSDLKYCYGSGDVTITGNYPGGTFSGPSGSIIDHGDGTATFSPSALVEGIYSISYSYTNSSGCSDTKTKNIEILSRPNAYIVTGGGSYCEGTGGISVGLSNSTTGVTYTLYRDGVAVVPANTVPGSTGNPVTFGNQTIAGSYAVLATSLSTGCTRIMTGSASVVVIPKLAIVAQPSDATVCESSTATFTIQATGENLSYQWKQNGINVGLNSSVLVLNNINLTDDDSQIFCEVTSTCGGTLTSNVVRLDVNPKTAINMQPVGKTACSGTGITLSVAASGINNVYRWQKNGASVNDVAGKISGATTSNLTILNLTTADAGTYIAYVQGDCGSEQQSNSAVVTVDSPITISVQPSSVVACAGTSTSFNVSASGTSLSYQWWFNNGVNPPVTAGSGPSLAINNVTAANAGTYYCIISSPCGETLTSTPATLTVPANTSITANPAGGSICEGSNFNFSVTATGDALTYKWYRDGTLLSDNAVVKNSATSNLSIQGAGLTYDGNYTVNVTGTCGSVWSAPAAVLNVSKGITFTSQPVSQTICTGSDATFSVVVTGDVLSYEWQFNTVPIAGATNSTYTVTAATAANAGNYRCLITTSDCGSFYSSEATLTINPTVIINTQPVALKTVCTGSTVSFSIAASGPGLTYQWFKNGASMGSGFRTPSMTLSYVSVLSEGSYTCKVSSTCGPSVMSQPGVLVVDSSPVISLQPLSGSVCLNSSYELTINLSSGTNAVYQWYHNGAPVGGNSPVYSLPSFTGADAGNYYCTVSNSCGTIQSNTAVLALVNPFTITQQPVGLSICQNGSATFNVAASEPGMSYQWMKNGADIAGATSSSLVLTNIPLSDNNAGFSCRVSNACGAINSNVATLNVSEPILITQQPQSDEACPGQPYTLYIFTTGSNPSYQWYRLSTGLIAGATNSTYSIGSFGAGDADTYYCTITNGCGTVTSNNAVITAGSEIVISNPAPLSLCEGQDATFTVTAAGTNPVFEWRKNDVPLSDDGRIIGTKTNTLTIRNTIPGDEGTYNVIVNGNCGLPKTSTGAFLDITARPVITVGPVPQTVCDGQNASFSVTVAVDPGDPAPTYRWQKDGADIVPAETASTLTITGATSADEGIFRCVITNGCGSINSTSAELIVEDNINIVSQPSPLDQCEGTNATFTVGITGPTNMLLQWYKDGFPLTEDSRITGVNTSSLTVNNLTFADEGFYWCEATSMCGNVSTSTAVLNVRENVTFNNEPVSVSVLQGTSATFTVAVSGDATGYQWYFGLNPLNDVAGKISGATTSALTIYNAQKPGDEGQYRCVVSGICGNVESRSATLTVLTSSVITTQPVSPVTQCEGTSLTLFIITSGAGHTYQWKEDDTNISNGANISGATTSTLTIGNTTTANTGAYTCVVDGVEISTASVVTINPSTIITVNPTAGNKCAGNTHVFAVTAEGSKLTYQWYRNDLANPVPGASSDSYTINSLTVADDGTYFCVVTGDCGAKQSSGATLIVNSPAVINNQPSSSVVCQGSTLNLTFDVSGSGLSYLWNKNGQPITDSNISGVNTPTLQISNSTPSNNGDYTCTVSSICSGNITSNIAVVTVNPTTTITVQPISRTKCEGDGVVFTVGATGSSLVYDWRFNNVSMGLPGSPTLTLNGLTKAANEGTYTCVVTGDCGAQTSTPAVLIINRNTSVTAPVISTNPVCQGGSTTISVSATGDGLTYLWTKDGQPITGSNVSGINTPDLIISNTLITDGGAYTCTVSGSCGSQTSSAALLQVNQATVITLQPVGQTLCEGDNVQFMVSATGTEPLSYQWRFNNADIAGAVGSTLTLNNISPSDAGAYTCFVSGASTCGNALSNPATLVVNPAITISSQPVNLTVCEDNNAIFLVNATGTNLLYKWKYNNAYITDDGRITGSATNQLSIANATNTDEGIYKCEILSTCGAKESNSAILTVTDSTKILTHPLSQTLLQGSDATFNVSATGEGLTYQWQFNNSDIPGANSNSFTIVNIQLADAGSYRCVVTGACGQVISNTALLTVNQPVIITTEPVSLIVCTGQTASFSVAASGTIVSYQWKFNGSDINDGSGISGSKTANLVISPAGPQHQGNYSCVVTGSNNIANSAVATLTVNNQPAITQQPLTQTKCDGDILVLEVLPSDPYSTYSWSFNGINLTSGGRISGAGSSRLIITDVSNADAGSYRCTVTNTCGTVTSNPAIVTINPVVTVTSNPSDLTQCEGQTGYFSITTNFPGASLQWYKNGSLLTDNSRISGSQTANLTINNLQVSDQGNYLCQAYDNCTSASSTAAQLTVLRPVTLVSQPSNVTVCQGENAFFNVSATGDNLVYQWQRNGVNLSDAGNIVGSQSSVLIIQNATTADQATYRCLITNLCNTQLTNTATLIVNSFPDAAGIITGSSAICQGSNNILYVVPAIANATGYVWSLPYGASIVSGAGTRSVLVNFSAEALSGVVSVHGNNSCGNGAESPLFTVTVNQIPTADAGPDQTICSATTTLNANVTAFGTWSLLSGLATISNPNLPNTPVNNIGQGRNVFLWSVSQNGCVATDTVVITNRQVYVNAGTDQTLCTITSVLHANTATEGTGSWSVISGGGTISNIFNPDSPVINLARGTNIFRWTINNQGCLSTDDVTVTNDMPTNAFAGKDTVILADNYTLDGNSPSVGTGRWTLLSGSATIINPLQNNTAVTNLGIGDNILQWTITNNMCISQDEVKVTNYTPTATDAGPAQTICDSRTTMLGTVPNYGTGLWSVISGSGTFVNPNKYDTEVINIGRGQNIYRWTIYEYKVTYDDVVITNNSPSNANAGIDQNVCTDYTNLAGNSPVIGTGQWTLTGGSAVISNPALYNSPVTALGAGSNTFRWTITNSGCTTFDEVVIVNDHPTAADAGVDQVTCADSVMLYPNTPTIGTGEWSIIQGSATFTGNKATNIARNQNVFLWTIRNNACTDSDTVIIVSNKPTTAYTGDDMHVCSDFVTLSGNAPVYGTGVWTKLSGSGTIANPADPRTSVTNLSYGSNQFRWTITYNGCTSFDDVVIYYDYVQADAGSDQTLCQSNAFLSASDPGEGTGLWTIVGGSGSANFVNQGQANTEVTGLDRGVNILRWTITHGGCVSSDDVLITNNTPSTAYAGSDRSTCGEDIYLSAGNPVIGTGEWSVLSGSATIQNPSLYNSLISNLSIGTNVLRWTVTNQGCTSTDEVVINNNKPTNIEAGYAQYLCSDSVQLYASAPAGGYGRWSISLGSATFSDNMLFNSMAYNLQKGENRLVWTVTIGGCSNSDTVTIVNNLPSTPSAGPDQDLCANSAFMAANQPLIGTGRWSIVSGSATFADLTSPSTEVTNMGNGDNILRWTITNGSCVLYDEVTIRNSLPTVAYAGEDRSVCNTTANLLATAPVSGTGSWSVVSGYGIFANPNSFNTQITDLGFGPNTLRWTTENGRCRTSDDVIITNNLATAYAGADQTVYTPDTRLVGNKPASGIGQWVILAGQGTIETPASNETNVTGLGGGANTFSWTINNSGCIASDDVVVTYKRTPTIEFIPRPGSGCAPLTVSFINNSVGGSPFLWDFGDGTTSSATNTNHTYTLPGRYVAKLRGTGPDGIAIYKDTVIVVEQVPVVDFEIAADTIYIPGESANFFNRTNNIDSLLWDFGDGNTSNENDPTHEYTNTGSYDVTLHAWTKSKCYSSLTISNAVFVDLAGIIKCPNAFTPNLSGPTGGHYNQNDFTNDVFHCYIEGVIEYHLEVYNRLGIVLFRSDDINIGWDGYFNGKLVEEGAYVYKVYGKFNNGKRFDFIGNIVLLH